MTETLLCFEFSVCPVSYLLIWRGRGLWVTLQPSARGHSWCFDFSFGELLCCPSLYALSAPDGILSWLFEQREPFYINPYEAYKQQPAAFKIEQNKGKLSIKLWYFMQKVPVAIPTGSQLMSPHCSSWQSTYQFKTSLLICASSSHSLVCKQTVSRKHS